MKRNLTLKRALGAFPSAWAFVQASNLASRQEWRPARGHLLRAYRLIGETAPSTEAPIEYNVKLAFVEARLLSFEDAINAAVCALVQMNGRLRRYGLDDVLYLQQFCIEIIEYCTHELGPDSWRLVPDEVRKRPDLGRLDVRRVSGWIRSYNLKELGPPYGSTGYGV